MVKIYTAPGCGPCREVKAAHESGNIEVRGAPSDNIELVDATSDEGYPDIDRLGIDKIPAAYHEGQKCALKVNDETGKVIVDCNEPEDDDQDR